MIFDAKGRLTENIADCGMAEGLPLLPPMRILRILKFKRQQELDSQRTLAMTLTKLMSAFSEGGDFLDITSHLYTKEMREDIENAQKEHKAEQSSLNMLERLRAVANHWDEKNG